MTQAAVIELRNVSFAYRPGVLALQDINFKVNRSDFVGLVGPNGGGKTTLLKLMLGVLQPLLGEVLVFGRSAMALGNARRLLGYVPQDTDAQEQFPATVLDVALMGTYSSLGLFRRPGAKERNAAREAICQVGLNGLENCPAGALSGGQRQRLSIARALVAQPQLLLLDEPTSGLDTGGQAQLFALIERLQKHYSLTVVMISHDVTALAYYADQLACLNRSLHWHDHSELISEAVLSKVYGCELDAFFISHRRHQSEFHNDRTTGRQEGACHSC